MSTPTDAMQTAESGDRPPTSTDASMSMSGMQSAGEQHQKSDASQHAPQNPSNTYNAQHQPPQQLHQEDNEAPNAWQKAGSGGGGVPDYTPVDMTTMPNTSAAAAYGRVPHAQMSDYFVDDPLVSSVYMMDGSKRKHLIKRPAKPAAPPPPPKPKMRVAANLSKMFTNVDLIARYEKAARLGFKLVEVPFPYSVPAEQLRAEADKFGLQHVLINAPPGNMDAGERGIAALLSKVDNFPKSLDDALHYARILDVKKIHVMAGISHVREPSSTECYIKNITQACQRFAEAQIECLIVPMCQHTTPGYFLRSLDQSQIIFDAVAANGATNLRLLFNVYHIQRTGGDLTVHLRKWASKIGHIQVAQVPDRNEPDSPGELDYEYVFNKLSNANPNWIVGCEYANRGDAKDYVQWVQKYGLEF